MQEKDYKLTIFPLVMMVFTTVYGFANVPRAFLMMGYGAIFWYILAALVYFLPYAVIMVEFGSAFSREKGGIYTWIRSSMGEKFAFIVVFMWYTSYIAWFVSTSTILWVPVAKVLELFNFNGGLTPIIEAFYSNSSVLGISAILFVMLVAYLISKGLKEVGRIASIGGLCVIFLNLLLIVGGLLVFVLNKFHLAEPLTDLKGLAFNVHQSNTPFSLISFVTFAIFAYGGLEVVSGIVDKVKNPAKTFPLGLTIGALVIASGYALMIFIVGIFTNWLGVMDQNGVNLGNVLYVVMEELGAQLGVSIGLRQEGALLMSKIFSGMVGFSMLLAYTGAFFAYFYSPLKQLIEGSPEYIWPRFFLKQKNNMPVGAIYMQALVVILILALNAFGGKGVSELMNRLIMMTNIAMTLPYVFIGIGYIKFRQSQSVGKGLLLIKNKNLSIAMAVMMVIFVGLAIFFTVLQPVAASVQKGSGVLGGLGDTIMLALGPLIFSLIGYTLYRYSQKNRT